MTTDYASSYLAGAERTNYRQRIAIFMPAILMSYSLLIWPLLYGRGIVPSDISGVAFVPVQTPLNKIYYPLAFLVSFAAFLPERRWFTHGWGVLLSLCIVIAYAGLTYFWALAPGKVLTQFVLLVLITLTLVMSTLTSRSLKKPLDVIFWVVMLTMAVNVVFVLLTPPSPIGHPGIYTHKNALGSTVAIGMIFAVYGAIRSQRHMRLVGIVMVPVCLFLLWESQSKTSLGLSIFVPVMAYVLYVMVRSLHIHLMVGIIALGVVGAAIIMMLNFVGIDGEMINTLIFRDPTFTGRTAIWAFSIEHIPDRLWLGHGFQSFWQIGASSPQLSAPPGFLRVAPDGHEGYLDMLLHFGVIGFGLFLWLLVMVINHISRVIRRSAKIGYFFTAFFLFYALINFLESTWFESLNDPSWALFAFMIFAPLAPGIPKDERV